MEEKNMVLELQNEDGTNARREVISIFDADNGYRYAALLPVDENDQAINDSNVELVRLISSKDGEENDDYIIEIIETEDELSIAREAFFRVVGATDNETNDMQVLTFTKDDGTEEQWQVVDLFDYSNRKYIALIAAANADNENVEINLMRAEFKVREGREECDVFAIPTQEEYEEVANVFEKRAVNNT